MLLLFCSLPQVSAKKPETGVQGSNGSNLKQYNILAALGIKSPPNSGGQENCEPPLKKMKETPTPMQLFKQLASKMWKPREASEASPTEVEGVVEERSDFVKELEKSEGTPSFQVQLKTASEECVRVTFSGAAARVFHRSLGLQRGSRIRIQGFTRFVRDGIEELRLEDVHPGVSVKVLATAAMSQSKEVLQLRDLQAHLAKVKKGEAKAVVTVEAIAKHIGKLEHEEPVTYAEQFGETLLGSTLRALNIIGALGGYKNSFLLPGRRILISNARVREAHGRPELTGCASMNIRSAV
ncbi:unnamed protein product [Cladocopium goreaui]|uniref:Uncharacterized protein n=1 Tax=Cladocopium goreaui TaxID=2562237 RepID=A0A9P1DMH4_9DINO|nr:unnamed protein product [Cladocopium goreaui]